MTMVIPTELKKTLDTPPVYAVVGATDLAVEKVRHVQGRLSGLRVEPRAVAGDVRTRVSGLQAQAVGLPVQASARALELTAQANHAYGGLVARGQSLTRRIRGQQATAELEGQAQTAVRAAGDAVDTAKEGGTRTRRATKTTGRTARKQTGRTTRATKAAATEGAKTAEATAKAAEDAAAKVG